LLQGCTSNGDRDRPTPENRWRGLLTKQQRDRRNHCQGTAPYRLISIRFRSRWVGSQPGFRPIRSDGSRGRLPDCRAWGPGRLVLTYPTASEGASLPSLVPVQRPSRYSPMIRPSCRTCAYPYSSERERHRSQARS